MNIRLSYFFGIILLALSLMLLISTAQYFTNRNIAGLKKGNQEAAITFTVQNSLQEIINIVFSLETKLTRSKISKEDLPGIKDSLTLIGYNAAVLAKLNLDTFSRPMFRHLNDQVIKQVTISYALMDAVEKENVSDYTLFVDSLTFLRLSDGIYNTSLKISKRLEAKLQSNLDQNTRNSRNLAFYNKILALVAIVAILILATIIINRHLRQLQLIADLEKASIQVKESASIKEQFLANMSHEIRTPLNAIKGFNSLLFQTKLDKEQQQYANIIENASDSLLEIVNDVLDISKIEAGKLELLTKEFNLKDILQVLELMFANTAANKNLQLSWHISEKVPLKMYGDADRLKQILMNLISNAIKFTPFGYIKISVQELIRSWDKCWFQFQVEDTGVGISEDKLDKVFERFYQVSNNVDSLQKGTGLGLAIVKNLSNLMGGDVVVESHSGKGSVFTVNLPFKLNLGTNRNQEEAISLIPDLQFSGVKLLVAEDNSVNQLLVKYLLKKYGIDPVFVQNGWEVIEKLKTGSYDLLLLDIQMPIINGYQVMEKINELKLELPVVAMTAFVMPGDKEKGLAAGMKDYITKPIDEVYLQKVLIKFLSKKRIGQTETNKAEAENFLLNLSGGDSEIANVILKTIKTELQVALKKLKDLKPLEENKAELKAFCHYLVSTVSPLGNDLFTMKSIKDIQIALERESSPGTIEQLVEKLQEDLKKLLKEQFIS